MCTYIRIALVKVNYSWFRPFTYVNVSGTYAYTVSYKFKSEYMLSLRHVGFSLSENYSRQGNSSCVNEIGEQIYSLRLSFTFSCPSFCCLPPRSRHSRHHHLTNLDLSEMKIQPAEPFS